MRFSAGRFIKARTIAALAGIAVLACLGGMANIARAAADTPWLDAPITSTYRPAPSPPVLLRNATILDGAGARIDRGDVLLRDGRIVAVGTDLPTAPDAQEIDAAGMWLTPGIIDVHSHNGTYSQPWTDLDSAASDISEMRNYNAADTWIETAVNPQDTAFAKALAAGVTTLQILPGSAPIFGGRSVVVKPIPAVTLAEMKFPGAPVGFKMACGENPKWASTDEGREDWPNSRQGANAAMRAAFAKARNYLADRRAGRPTGADARTIGLAGILAGDLRLHFHCYRASDMAAMLSLATDFGFTITTFQHAGEAYKIANRLKAAGTCSAVWSDWWGFKVEALDIVRANAALLEEADACVMMHSDSPTVGQRLNMEAAKAAAAGRRIGIETAPETMITWLTSVPAKALGLEDRIGTIAPRYNADLVLWSGDPFSVYSSPKLVLIDGAVRYDAGQPPAPPDFELGRKVYSQVLP